MKKLLLISVLLPFGLKAQTVTNYPDVLIDFSTQYDTCSQNWAACRALGAPDFYPGYADDGRAWTASDMSGANSPVPGREWLVLGFSTPVPADSVIVYETYGSGGTDTVYVRNSSNGNWVTIWDTTAYDQNNIGQANAIRIALASSLVIDAVRVAVNNGNYANWNEIDAVGVVGSSSGIAGNNTEDFVSISPNPNNGIFTIRFSTSENRQITIYNALGQTVNVMSCTSDQFEGNIPQAPGIYSAVITNNDKTSVMKFIIE